MGVDPDRAMVIMTGEMNLPDVATLQRFDILKRIEPVVHRTDEDVVDVEEQSASRELRKLTNELPFAHR